MTEKITIKNPEDVSKFMQEAAELTSELATALAKNLRCDVAYIGLFKDGVATFVAAGETGIDKIKALNMVQQAIRQTLERLQKEDGQNA